MTTAAGVQPFPIGLERAENSAPYPDGMPSRRAPGAPLAFFLVDALLVLLFTAVGRASHADDVLAGLAQTAWPFLLALGAGWLASRAWRAPASPVRTGLPVWAVTVVGGMALRAVSGQGVQIAFVVVTALVLLVLLVGWRGVAAAVARRRARV